MDQLDQGNPTPEQEKELSLIENKILEYQKIEYEDASKRYQNIYQSIWQNFSYMAALAAGILTFASDSLALPLAACIALTPLIFWFLATYIPLDHYGQKIRKRLSIIETNINLVLPDRAHLGHYIEFSNNESDQQGSNIFVEVLSHIVCVNPKNGTQITPWRVRQIVYLGGRCCIFWWIVFLVFSGMHYFGSPESPPSPILKLSPTPLEIQIDSYQTDKKIAKLEKKIDSMNKLIQEINNKIPN